MNVNPRNPHKNFAEYKQKSKNKFYALRFKVIRFKKNNNILLLILTDNLLMNIIDSRACTLIVNSDKSNEIGSSKHLVILS